MDEFLILEVPLSCEMGSREERDHLLELERRLVDTISANGRAVYDGHEFGGGQMRSFFFAECANDLALIIHSSVEPNCWPRGTALVFNQDAVVEEVRIPIGPSGSQKTLQ